jgi:hypothetical protein
MTTLSPDTYLLAEAFSDPVNTIQLPTKHENDEAVADVRRVSHLQS